jgi:hypothetical protein
MSKFNQRFFELGVEDRLNAELKAFKNNEPLQVPIGSHHATARSYWLKGFNSVSATDIECYLEKKESPAAKKSSTHHIERLRASINQKEKSHAPHS